MKTKTTTVLSIMHVLAWVTFIGLMIKAGAILISYGVSVVNPESAKNLYSGLDLYNLRQLDLWYYSSLISLMVAIVALKAYIAYLVIRVLSRIRLDNPFTMEVSNILEQISYYIFGIWILVVLHNAHVKWLLKRMDGLQADLMSPEFIFMAGVVFVMSQIFKKGVEIQTENELTV